LLYGENIEEETKLCKQELAYVIPEPKKEPVTSQAQIKREDLVSGILDELDKRKKISSWIWAVVGIVILVGAGFGYNFFSKAKTEKLTADKVKAEEQQKQQTQQNELANLIKVQNEKIKQLELLAATATEAQKKTLELEKLRLDDLKKKKAEEQAKQKADEETRKQLEAEQIQKDLDAKKVLDELKKKEDENQKQQEIEKKRVEAVRVKEGDQLSLTEVTVKPEKISGAPPPISGSLKSKYSGKTMTIQALLLVDENGDVAKTKILTSNVANDIKSVLEDTLYKWKYKPALKDNVKVKVWMTVAIKFTF
jgi:hypothetical protein